MKFCVKCDNMYYIGVSVDDPNQLTYYCRNCKHKDETLTEEGLCVLNSQLKKDLYLPILFWQMKSIVRLQRCNQLCWKRCRKSK